MLLIRWLVVFMMLASFPAQAADENPAQEQEKNIIKYDQSSDLLQVVVKDFSLKLLLTRIAQQSRLEVLFDEAAEDTISLKLQEVPLEQGLKNLLIGRSYIMQYGKDSQQKTMLTGITVLPQDKQDDRQARRLVSMDDEAYSHSLSQLSPQQMNQISVVNERWQARLKNLSPERREAMEKRAAKRVIAQVAHEKKREEKEQARKIRIEKRDAMHKEKQEALLGHLAPEQRAVIEQEGLAAREQMKNQISVQLQNPQQ